MKICFLIFLFLISVCGRCSDDQLLTEEFRKLFDLSSDCYYTLLKITSDLPEKQFSSDLNFLKKRISGLYIRDIQEDTVKKLLIVAENNPELFISALHRFVNLTGKCSPEMKRIAEFAAALRQTGGKMREIDRLRLDSIMNLPEKIDRPADRNLMRKSENFYKKRTIFQKIRKDYFDSVHGITISQGFCETVLSDGTEFLRQTDQFLKTGEVILTINIPGKWDISRKISVLKKLGRIDVPLICFADGDISGIRNAFPATGLISVSPGGFSDQNNLDDLCSDLDFDDLFSRMKYFCGQLENITGKTPLFFSPPYSIISRDQALHLLTHQNVITMGFTIDSLDWSTLSTEEMFQRLVREISAKKKGIISFNALLHSAELLQKTVSWLKLEGYTVRGEKTLVDGFFHEFQPEY